MTIEFENKPLEWGVEGVEPSDEKKALGFADGEAPAAGHWDHKFRRDFLVQKELQEKVSELSEKGIDTSTLVTKEEFTSHKTDYIQHIGYAIATGLANEYIATLTPALSKYQEGFSLRLKINVDNTGASTVNVNELGAKAIKKANGADVTSGNLKSGSVYTIVYNGTNFILQGEGGELSDADLLTFINDVNTLTKM